MTDMTFEELKEQLRSDFEVFTNAQSEIGAALKALHKDTSVFTKQGEKLTALYQNALIYGTDEGGLGMFIGRIEIEKAVMGSLYGDAFEQTSTPAAIAALNTINLDH